jgi:hypothetical protein
MEVCAKCGEPARKYLDRSPYHSFYCSEHYKEKLAEFGDDREYLVKANVKPSNPFFKDNTASVAEKVGMVKGGYGYE